MKSRGRVAPAHAIALLPLLAGVVASLLSAKHGLGEPLFYVLLTAAVLARLLTTTLEENLGLSASFLCGMLAIGFLDPLSAFLIPFAAEGVGWLVERYRPQALIINWAGSATPTAFAALGFEGLSLDQHGAAFPIVLGLFGAGVLLVNFVTVAPLMAMLDERAGPRDARRPAGLLSDARHQHPDDRRARRPCTRRPGWRRSRSSWR